MDKFFIEKENILYIKNDFPKNYQDLLNLIKKEYNIEKDKEYLIRNIFYKKDDNIFYINNDTDYEFFKNNSNNKIYLDLGFENNKIYYNNDLEHDFENNKNKLDVEFENINNYLDIDYNNNNNDNNLNGDFKFEMSNNLRNYIDEYLDEKIKLMKINIFLEFIKKQSSVNSINNNIIHYDINCSKCKQLIEGIRYKCSFCVNYNLCSKCEESNEHEHDFFKIKKNENKQREKEVNEMVKKLKKENKIKEKYDDYSIIKAIIENKYNIKSTKNHLLKKLENKNKDEKK